MSVTSYLPRPLKYAIRLAPCCGARDLIRLRRRPLLRWLFPMRQLYLCPHCGSKVFYKR